MSDILVCNALTKQYGTFQALSNINLTLESGKIVGLLGPNGSGKSTLIKTAAGLLQPTSGELRIAGILPGKETKKIVSYLPERTYLNNWMRVRELIAYFADFYPDFNRSKAEDMLARLQIDPDARIKTLSKGTKEKVQLIMVMSREAKLYLLDEPIGGVDPAAREYILNTIISNYCEDACVVISTHLIADIETVLDDVVFLYQGKTAMHESVEGLREKYQKSVDALFREVYRC